MKVRVFPNQPKIILYSLEPNHGGLCYPGSFSPLGNITNLKVSET